MRKFRPAFTLVELLVVISVVVVLMALLAPMVSNMIKRAELAKCMSNMKQIAFAMQNYAGDNNLRLPSAVTDNRYDSWLLGKNAEYDEDGLKTGSIHRYITDARIYVCPSAEDVFDPTVNDLIPPLHTYTMNIRLSRRPMTVATGMEQKVVLLVEESGGDRGTILKPPDGGGKERYGAFEKTDRPARHHVGGSTNVLYLDFHAETVVFEPDVEATARIFDSRDPEGVLTPTPGVDDSGSGGGT